MSSSRTRLASGTVAAMTRNQTLRRRDRAGSGAAGRGFELDFIGFNVGNLTGGVGERKGLARRRPRPKTGRLRLLIAHCSLLISHSFHFQPPRRTMKNEQ